MFHPYIHSLKQNCCHQLSQYPSFHIPTEYFVFDPKQLGFPDWRQFQFVWLSLVNKGDWYGLLSSLLHCRRHDMHILFISLFRKILCIQELGQVFKQEVEAQSLATAHIVYLHL